MAVKKRTDFYTSEEGIKTRALLVALAADKAFNTETSYTTNAEKYPDHVMPFVDKHMNYLLTHPGVESHNYLSNLRIMTRIRQ